MSSFLTDAGYWALILFAFIEACSIPISSEVTFGFAGVLAYEHHMTLPLVIILGSLAEIAGASVAYGIGRKGGRRTVERFRKYVLMTRKDVERAERFFAGRGTWTVGVARVAPLIRTFGGLVSGLVEVPGRAFAVYNVIGTVIYAIALSTIGYALGSDWSKIEKGISYVGYLLVVLIIAALILHRLYEVRKERAGDTALAGAEAEPPVSRPKHRAPSGRGQ